MILGDYYAFSAWDVRAFEKPRSWLSCTPLFAVASCGRKDPHNRTLGTNCLTVKALVLDVFGNSGIRDVFVLKLLQFTVRDLFPIAGAIFGGMVIPERAV